MGRVTFGFAFAGFHLDEAKGVTLKADNRVIAAAYLLP